MNDCILWSGAKSGDGYGTVTRGGRQYAAHRVAWSDKNGPIPNGKWVLHKCDKPLCVNPEHLFLGTAKENTQDCIAKNRRNTPYGARHANAKLDESKAAEIRNSKGKVNIKDLASKYGISTSVVSNIWTWKTWKHVGAQA